MVLVDEGDGAVTDTQWVQMIPGHTEDGHLRGFYLEVFLLGKRAWELALKCQK